MKAIKSFDSFSPSKTWKKILYERQPYSDNYVDDQKFLEQLEQTSRTNIKPISLTLILIDSSIVAQQLSIITIFLSIYKYIRKYRERSSVLWNLVYFDLLLLIIGFILHCWYDKYQISVTQASYSSIIFIICLRAVAPVLQTLTSSYSSDTIHALTIIFSSVHLVAFDYAYVSNIQNKFHGILSLNAAMFSAVLLASRLESIEIVVAFILLAVILFSLLPNTMRILSKVSRTWHIQMSIYLWLFATILLAFLDRMLFAVYEVLLVVLWFVGPLSYVYMQRYKKVLRGPWDIAVLENLEASF